jgi:hypothetical protein
MNKGVKIAIIIVVTLVVLLGTLTAVLCGGGGYLAVQKLADNNKKLTSYIGHKLPKGHVVLMFFEHETTGPGEIQAQAMLTDPKKNSVIIQFAEPVTGKDEQQAAYAKDSPFVQGLISDGHGALSEPEQMTINELNYTVYNYTEPGIAPTNGMLFLTSTDRHFIGIFYDASEPETLRQDAIEFVTTLNPQ